MTPPPTPKSTGRHSAWLAPTITLLVRPLTRRAAHRELNSVLTGNAISNAVNDGFRRFQAMRDEIPHEPTLGARVMTHFAALTISLYRALRAAGIEKKSACDYTAAINWRVYKRLTYIPYLLTRPFSGDRIRRVKRSMDWYMRFPYASPGYKMEWVVDETDVVGFDVTRCPAAELFASQDLGPLCSTAFCDLDYPLAEIWKVELHRPTTIAKGCEHCEFRFHRK
ncbi:MAG: L-2-amino-thiazoline-4-carboxylic acid hydrolase [Alcanivorax sp.]|nr:L-2-amino-thiazoline-4-carboxylic acid hydrolase [Alcanivorax sp.]